jgi:hypothetical protein
MRSTGLLMEVPICRQGSWNSDRASTSDTEILRRFPGRTEHTIRKVGRAVTVGDGRSFVQGHFFGSAGPMERNGK